MKFSVNARLVAEDRQDKNDGWGPLCARCYENFRFAETFAIPRIPFAKGGTQKADNCVILCNKCYLEIREDHPEIVPYSELPCFKV